MYWLNYSNKIEEHSESPFQDPRNIEHFFRVWMARPSFPDCAGQPRRNTWWHRQPGAEFHRGGAGGCCKDPSPCPSPSPTLPGGLWACCQPKHEEDLQTVSFILCTVYQIVCHQHVLFWVFACRANPENTGPFYWKWYKCEVSFRIYFQFQQTLWPYFYSRYSKAA